METAVFFTEHSSILSLSSRLVSVLGFFHGFRKKLLWLIKSDLDDFIALARWTGWIPLLWKVHISWLQWFERIAIYSCGSLLVSTISIIYVPQKSTACVHVLLCDVCCAMIHPTRSESFVHFLIVLTIWPHFPSCSSLIFHYQPTFTSDLKTHTHTNRAQRPLIFSDSSLLFFFFPFFLLLSYLPLFAFQGGGGEVSSGEVSPGLQREEREVRRDGGALTFDPRWPSWGSLCKHGRPLMVWMTFNLGFSPKCLNSDVFYSNSCAPTYTLTPNTEISLLEHDYWWIWKLKALHFVFSRVETVKGQINTDMFPHFNLTFSIFCLYEIRVNCCCLINKWEIKNHFPICQFWEREKQPHLPSHHVSFPSSHANIYYSPSCLPPARLTVCCYLCDLYANSYFGFEIRVFKESAN